jgi:hypothetical protein
MCAMMMVWMAMAMATMVIIANILKRWLAALPVFRVFCAPERLCLAVAISILYECRYTSVYHTSLTHLLLVSGCSHLNRLFACVSLHRTPFGRIRTRVWGGHEHCVPTYEDRKGHVVSQEDHPPQKKIILHCVPSFIRCMLRA